MIKNTEFNEYLHSNGSLSIFDDGRRYVFASVVSESDLNSNQNFGHWWYFNEISSGNYHVVNYLTKEHLYVSAYSENEMNLVFTWIGYLEYASHRRLWSFTQSN